MSEHIYGSVKCERIPEYRLERREEIVRCRDCRHEGKPYECWLGETKPDEFCSRGKRKEGGDD